MATGLTVRLASGAIGAGVLTAVHQTAQRVRDDAPRMDIVGMRALARAIAQYGRSLPDDDQLYRLTLAGDLFSNALYYSAVPAETSGKTWRRAVAMGLAAGFGALLLPRYVAGGDPPHSHHVSNNVMTIAWYLAGAVAAAAFANAMRGDNDQW